MTVMMRAPFSAWLFCMAFLSCLPVAQAQLILPGAVQAPAKSVKPQIIGRDGQPVKRAKSAAVKVPGEEAITGQDMALNGSRGRIVFARNADSLNITSLTLDGAQISHPDDTCRVDVVSGAPLIAKPLGRPTGALRFGVELEACPFSFDVLEGAILVGPVPAICQFPAADCKVDPAGLWGPRASALTGERIKQVERSRVQLENTMRENFRDLLSRTHGKAAIKAVASEQAGFTSARAQICRDYVREDVHGFCSLRLTEARAMALKVMVGQVSQDDNEKKSESRRKRRGAVPL